MQQRRINKWRVPIIVAVLILLVLGTVLFLTFFGSADGLSPEAAYWQGMARSFNNSDFGTGSIVADLEAYSGVNYSSAPVSPVAGQHPRVLFTSESVEGLTDAFADAKQVARDGYNAALSSPPDGILANDEFDATDTAILRDIQTLALDYQRTGDALSGYHAIYAIKNVLKTLGANWTGHDDVAHRYYGYAMYIAACVYDWCYDLMNTTDKNQIVLGVQEKICKVGMTVTYAVGFPPTSANAVSGHGTSFCLLRDYLAFAIAIYDEYPGWWDMIAGRFFEEYVPVRNAFYEAGMVPQGVSLYVRTKFFPDLFSAWLVKAATGVFPYESEENMKQVARSIYTYELRVNNGALYSFPSGDDKTPYNVFIDYGHIALISSYLFNDETMRAQLEHNYQSGSSPTNQPYGSSYRNFSGDITETASIAEYLICSSSGVEAASSRHEGMDLIQFNGGWLGQIIARNTWGREQATVLMKIGQRTAANHDHYDAGTFQIFYNSILSGDTGVYDGYGNSHHYYYHQATVAHNGLLIYNPALSSTDGGYYSGGQKRRSEPGEYEVWQSNTYKTGELTGVAYAYADEDETEPLYAYIAGDIASAYDSSVANEVTRRMLTVYDTGNSSVPLFFFVFDNIAAKSATFKKTFLLHVKYEPTISGNTVIANCGTGRLVLQNVIGNNVTITARGGSGHNYEVNHNGANSYVQLNSPNNKNDNYWGRVEISPATGNATDQLLNVMYVCKNNSSAPSLSATPISNSTVKGAEIGNVTAVFVVAKTQRTTAFSFTSTGSGTRKYYVSGVAGGEWSVSVNGTPITTAEAEGGLLVFSAPSGNVTLTPSNLTGYGTGGNLGSNAWPSVSYSSIAN